MAGKSVTGDTDGAAVDHEAAIRAALAEWDPLKALYQAAVYLRSAMVGEIKRRPADAALLGAWLAGVLFHLAAGLRDREPYRPPGSQWPPRPQDLARAFEAGRNNPTEGI
jgi:hypothetical protein